MMTTDSVYLPPIIGALLFAMLPHTVQVPFWITAWCIVLWGYLLLSPRYRLRLPDQLVRRVLTIIGIAGIPLTFGFKLGGNAYIGLLMLMAGLKPLETRAHRDRMVCIFLAYFIIITRLLNSDSLLLTLYMVPSVWITTAVLIHVNHPVGKIKEHFRLSAIMMAQAAPLMIVLFFLFPRFQGNIWGLTRQMTGKSGFSDTLSPGSIAELVRNNETAFKAEFSDSIPRPELLYWRGIVFDRFNGRAWKRSDQFLGRIDALNGADPVEYTIVLEPHDQRWLFALDLPVAAPAVGAILADHTIISFRRFTQKLRYKLSSYTNFNTGALKRWEHHLTELPDTGNPRARQLAQNWMNTMPHPESIINAALNFFKENGFVYTLNPPLLKDDPIDEFLFQSRQGYCEHYASAFVFLMRASGIPARVVGGYLGGELNPYGHYLNVRQSDAHAWAEVWLAGKGWVRIDPTLTVAPGRVRQGVEGILSSDELPAFLSLKRLGWLASYWRDLRFGWDAVSNRWDLWIMGYTFEEQRDLLALLGIKGKSWKIRTVGLVLAFIWVGVSAALFSLWLFRKPAAPSDKVQEIWQQFCRKLEQAGIARKPHQGPLDYARAIISQRQDIETHVVAIIRLYIDLRYGKGGHERSIRQLKKMVRQLRVH